MVKKRRSAVVTPDGILDLPEDPSLTHNDEYGAPGLQGHLVVSGINHDANIALAQELHSRNLLQVIGKSGPCRAGMELIARDDPNQTETEFDYRRGRIVLPVEIMSLRAVQVRQNGVRDDFLRILEDIRHERPVHVGRLALVRPEDALSKEEVLQAFRDNTIAISSRLKPEECIAEDGVIELPLEDLHYAFCEANFRTDQKRDVLRFGKHGLNGVQEQRRGLQPSIDGKEFFVGAVRISIGPFVAIIDKETNQPGIVHLAARVLDGIRTTGLNNPRQVELFNQLYETASTSELKVRIRLYHANKDIQRFSRRVINERTIDAGVSLTDVIELQQHPERIISLMKAANPGIADGDPAGYFVGAGKAHTIRWDDKDSSNFYNAYLEETAPKFAAGDRDYVVRGDGIMLQPAAELSKLLGYVGQDQYHRNMHFQWGFPDTDTMREMRKRGIGAFVAHDLRMPTEAFDKEQPYFCNKSKRTVKIGGVERQPVNSTFFTDKEFAAFQKLGEEGAKFFLVRHETPDAFGEVENLPEEVLEWDKRGFWIRPGSSERIEKVDTLIAMYGSHTKGMTDVLKEQILRFALRMKKKFGDSVGFIHGKGPGVMQIADYVARNLPELAKKYPEYGDDLEEIASIGVGIDLEQQDQKLNHHPHGQIDFGAQHRLVRQKHMNDRAAFNIFNLGGAGTLEEIALSLCSQKLYKNILTPLIFVDPVGISNEGENFWDKLKTFIDDMSTTKTITIENEVGVEEDVTVSDAEVSQAQVNIQLLQGHMKNCIHVVNNYDEAADIIENFVDDPVGYYTKAGIQKDEFELSFAGATDIRRDTHFPMPNWMAGSAYADMLTDDRWENVA